MPGRVGSESSFASVSRYIFDGDRADVRAKTVDRTLKDVLEALEEQLS